MEIKKSKISKLKFLCVNYNTENEILRLISSIKIPSSDMLSFYIIDNSNTFDNHIIKDNNISNIDLTVLKPPKNLGYFGAIRYAIDVKNCVFADDFVVVANPDLTLASDFFDKISIMEIPDDVGVIAPQVVNYPSGEMANPFMKSRPSKFAIWIRRLVHRHPYIFSLYEKLSIFKQYLSGSNTACEASLEDEYIYAPHGSMVIFCPIYLSSGGDFEHEGFLFAEELYVAETCIQKNLRILNCNSLKVSHYQHASIKKLKVGNFSRYAFDSLDFIYERFFR